MTLLSRSGFVLAIPPEVQDSWRSAWPGPAGDAEVAGGFQRLYGAIERWSLSSVEPMNGACWGAVYSAIGSDGRDVVLKINPENVEPGRFGSTRTELEPGALALWAKAGFAPEVIRAADSGRTYLMERADPGTSLLDRGGSGTLAVMRTLGTVVGQLHKLSRAVDPIEIENAPRLAGSSEIAKWRRALADSSEGALLDELLSSSTEEVLLHLDLHSGNLLRHADSWWVIDPKPHLGDPHAEMWGLIFHEPFTAGLPADPGAAAAYVREHIDDYCTAAGLEAGRTAKWLQVRLAYRTWRAKQENTTVGWIARLPHLSAAINRSFGN
jgi:streptomycin 6-kinase